MYIRKQVNQEMLPYKSEYNFYEINYRMNNLQGGGIIKIKVFFDKISNHENITNIFCDSRTLFYKAMLVLNVLGLIAIMQTFYLETSENGIRVEFENILSMAMLLLLFIFPIIYLTLKIFNFKFYIFDEKIIYKNIKGRELNYIMTDIKNANCYGNNHGYNFIVIKFYNDKRVIISSYDRNYDVLKKYLNYKKILKL